MSFQPAGLTRMATHPRRSSTAAAQRRVEPESDRSTAANSTARLAAPASFWSSRPFSLLAAAHTTAAPRRANSITVALPMPDAPPVTSAILPSSFINSLLCSALRALGAGKEGFHALKRLGIRQQPPRRFELVRVAAAPGLPCRRAARLARSERRRRQPGDGASGLAGAP